MFFLNLSPLEFTLLLSAVSGLAVALYLLDRSRRRQVVPTLRFWTSAGENVAVKHRRHIRQPWSLLLQLAGMALLLLALAEPRLGLQERAAPEHILLLDTSSWMSARWHGSGDHGDARTLMDQARRQALAWADGLPASDQVMLVRADALATPATAMSSDRAALREAILRSSSGATALHLAQAVEFALEYRRLHSGYPGEIVYAGAARVADTAGELEALAAAAPALRVLPVAGRVENVGLRRIGLRRSGEEPGVWELFISVRNYGAAAHDVPVMVKFGGAPVASRLLTAVLPGADREATLSFRSRAAGWVEVALAVDDDLGEDDRAILELPPAPTLPVAVYSDEPDLLRPLFAGIPRVEARFLKPAAYTPDAGGARIAVLDRFRPRERPTVPSIWIAPPHDGSPIPVRASREKVTLERWRTDHALGAGLHARDIQLAATDVYEPAPADIPVAEIDSGPVILARPGEPRLVALGFHPMHSALRLELATPLLFANVLRWMEPDIFSIWELNAAPVGSVNLELDAGVPAASVKVAAERGGLLPFNLRERSLHFFSGEPGIVRVTAGDREMVYSLALPEIAEASWTEPPGVKHGIPPRTLAAPLSRPTWPWLAAIGALLLLGEWLLFGRQRGLGRR